ncbi:MAG TPA: acetyl-CoA carboxylase biotin carboxyl carrier protein [Bryobacteraceae bacterium]|nr:acetyl-CoA carboxylase biotin carboxyl carrier protein [Bryobacteraceae bacterium]
MNISEIKEMIQAVVESGVAELEVQRGENRVRIVRGGQQQEIYVSSPGAPLPAPAHVAPAHPTVQLAPAPPAPATEDDKNVAVKSPIVGTFYSAASPGAAPFVAVGDVVKPGQVLCIVESMKLMNEIESEVAGTIVARLVENGAPVEYGASLFTVRPH